MSFQPILEDDQFRNLNADTSLGLNTAQEELSKKVEELASYTLTNSSALIEDAQQQASEMAARQAELSKADSAVIGKPNSAAVAEEILALKNINSYSQSGMSLHQKLGDRIEVASRGVSRGARSGREQGEDSIFTERETDIELDARRNPERYRDMIFSDSIMEALA